MNNVYIPPPNGGMLDIAVAGLNAWDKNRRYQADQDRAQQEQEAGLLSKGLMLDRRPKIEDPNDPSGQTQIDNPDYDPNHPRVVRDKVADAAYQQNTQEAKAGTDASKQRVLFAKSLLGQILPQVPDPNDKTGKTMKQNPVLDALDEGKISGTQARMYLDQFKPEIQAYAQIRGRQASLGLQREKFDETKNQNAIKAGESFENDSIIKQSKSSQNSLDRASSILTNPNKPVTSKDLALAYQDFINAVAVGGQATEGKVGREMPETWAQEWNNLKAKAGEMDDLRASPTGQKLINLLTENIKTVHGDLDNQITKQAKNRSADFSQSTNQKVQKTVQSKLKAYAPEQGGGQGQGLVGAKGLVNPDNVGPHGATVYQNGHMFKWNPQTKVYE